MLNKAKPKINIPVGIVVRRAIRPPMTDAIATVIKIAITEDTGEMVCNMVGPRVPLLETRVSACHAPNNPTIPVANTTNAVRIQVSIYA